MGRLICVMLIFILSGCAPYLYKIDKTEILNVFDKDKQLFLLAMERTKCDIFDSAKILNEYLSTHEKYNENEYKEYLSEKSSISSWYIDKWWKDVMLNYNLLVKMKINMEEK